MPWCPNCVEEYIDGIRKCPECGNDLQKDMPEKPVEAIQDVEEFDYNIDVDYEEKLLFVAENQIDFTFITEALEKEKVLFRTEKEGGAIWQHYDIIANTSLLGIKVFVRDEDFEKAKQIYDYFTTMKNDTNESEDINN